MFDKGTEEKTVEVVADLTDGREIFGRLVCGMNGKLGSVLNSDGQFVELRDSGGHSVFIAKNRITAIEPAKGGKRIMPVLQMAALESQGWASVLQILPTASFDEVKSAYYQLAKQYHPDKFPETVPAEIRNYANDMFARINVAWEQFQAVKRVG